ncbi:MAG: hypothetical protein RLZZ297_1868 [Chloroflexota bacterium]|jgi:uncharacterized protein (DUF488 family)
MHVYTIGFTKKSAAVFFETLRSSGARRIVDIRLNNVSQLAGFAKKDDLAYFARTICAMDYVAEPLLAPTQALLDGQRKQHQPWSTFAPQFTELLRSRAVERSVPRTLLDGGVLLCSEHHAHECHRSIVVAYLQEQWGPFAVTNLE